MLPESKLKILLRNSGYAIKIIRICFLILLLTTGAATAQRQRSEITKITYASTFGGGFANDNAIWLEVNPNGLIRMFNDTYFAPDSGFNELMERGSGIMSAASFKQLAYKDSLADYFTGRITSSQFQDLANTIAQMSAHTSMLIAVVILLLK